MDAEPGPLPSFAEFLRSHRLEARLTQEMLAERAAVLIHEMWHHWQNAQGMDSSHLDGPRGQCTAGSGACDWYYPHAPGAKLPDGSASDDLGGLRRTNVVNGRGLYFHSPYQVMTEFETDIAIWGSSVFMPFAVRSRSACLTSRSVFSPKSRIWM